MKERKWSHLCLAVSPLSTPSILGNAPNVIGTRLELFAGKQARRQMDTCLHAIGGLTGSGPVTAICRQGGASPETHQDFNQCAMTEPFCSLSIGDGCIGRAKTVFNSQTDNSPAQRSTYGSMNSVHLKPARVMLARYTR